MQSVRPIRLAAGDSWMWPCSETTGWYSSIACRTAVEPTGIMCGSFPISTILKFSSSSAAVSSRES